MIIKSFKMVDNSAAKSHLNSIEAKLNNMTDLASLSAVIHKTSLDLENVLGAGKNLFVDNDIKASVNSIVTRLENGIVDDIDPLFVQISNQYAAAVANPLRIAAQTRWDDLQNKRIGNNTDAIGAAIAGHTTRSGQLNARFLEYQDLQKYINGYNGNISTIPDPLSINVAAPAGTIDVSGRKTDGALPDPNYELCDADGKSIKSGSDYKVKIGSNEHTITGIHRDNATKHFEIIPADFAVYPPLTSYPQAIELSVNAVCSGITRGINVIHNKKFKLTLNDGTPKVNSVVLRDAAFEQYETSGTGHIISNQLNTKIDTRNPDPEIGKNVLERKAIESALRYKGGTKYDTLSDKQKRLFYQRVYRAGFFAGVYTGGGVIDEGAARYDKMKAWFVHGSRPRNNDDSIIGSASAYKTYIHSHLDEKCDEYILDTLQNYLQENAMNTKLKAELSRFLQEIDNNKLDDDHVNTNIHRDLDHKKYKMEKGPASLFHPRDVNYMRFFSGASTSLKNEKVNIYSRIDNPEPIEYDMDLSVSGKNNIQVEIKIKGTNEVIKQKAGEPTTLVRKIMRDQRLQYGKLRAHIGFNIYKSIVRMAQEKNISLTYRGMEGKMQRNRRSQEIRQITLDNTGNIVIKQINHTTSLNSENNMYVFDQNTFLNTNEFENGPTNGTLREGLETLAYHFNIAMNHLHKQYRKATERRVGKLLPSRNRLWLPTSFWLSPIKKILNAKTTTNFDFDTTVNAGGENIKIKFTKNKFTIETKYKKGDKTVDIKLKGKDLGKLLNHREGKVRVFDGIERDIVEGVYSSLIDSLRKNAKIARTNFGVKDDITGNMYILDEDGEFGVIAKEDFTGRNKINNPMKGSFIFRGAKGKGTLKKRRLEAIGWRPLEEGEKKELLKNPFLMQKFVKAMNRRMGLRGSIGAMF